MSLSAKNILISKLKANGITDESVLDAFLKCERHKFLPSVMAHLAYEDTALHIGFGQTISQPTTVAIMTQSARIRKGDRVLEVGTGSGFQAAILAEMGAKVFTIEREYDLHIQSRDRLEKLGYSVHTKWGDGSIGWNEFAPYDAILVTAGSPTIPTSLKNQLAEGGRLIIPVGDRESQKMLIITKINSSNFETEEIPEFKFVPLLGKDGWKRR
ncbi:MAG: protein-L-isoaspartate(D-aspartate) O-methyltransferase [Ignavibacteriales bacterium]|nr:MAG: protein-L-isoaspartate(D-aspartate) O-methyltransferase [Ignavibacteriaceae bacterium]MBW7872198.1 protein-L-isoaspartate(D-aspartate) O-methyltransferase [Ignavibacteria bacterium]MCZ2144011.1 protein-L-isoaspartate(D-aspartate) O-methyltransferase [Ignavibacteriales bacterium]MBV6445656.1 Protein-L-isoaspartate O-methyltransferase [Ignavibacteriaceae bacterium]MBZ0197371.1 protein-L-isoaspartate(D-aspartate) O-methyltransferase [Ignavibacteriaceae bacterium]